MDVRYTDQPQSTGQSSRLKPGTADEVVVTFPGGDVDDLDVCRLEVRLSDGRWKGMAEAFRDGDLITSGDGRTAFFESQKQQAGIPARTVTASVQDVQTAAAQLSGHDVPTVGWCTSVENTGNGVVMRGPWSDTGDERASGTWIATYEVEPAEHGRSTLWGVFLVARADEFPPQDSLKPGLAAVAEAQTTLLEVAAEQRARQRSPELERTDTERPALSRPASDGRPMVTLTGWLVADPVRSTLEDGDRDRTVTNFRLGVDKDGARTFYNVAAWDKTAEAVAAHKKKGHRVTVSGREQERTWTGRDGKEHTSVNVNARRVEFLPPQRQVPLRDGGSGMER